MECAYVVGFGHLFAEIVTSSVKKADCYKYSIPKLWSWPLLNIKSLWMPEQRQKECNVQTTLFTSRRQFILPLHLRVGLAAY